MPAHSLYCYDHKAIGAVAWATASAADNPDREQAMAYYKHCRDKDEAKFRKLILDTERACSERKRGVKRKGP
eukprot:8133818-Alexandrium_andersonii.AAC.1